MEIPFKQTPNYAKGTTKKRGYVIHQTMGNFKGDVDWLMNSNRPNRSSAHYVIGRNTGEIVQLVNDTDDAWHAGNICTPAPYATARLLKNLDGTYVNPNRYLIGIELTSRYDYDKDGVVEPHEIDITPWQYECVAFILKKNEALIPVKPDMWLFSHKEICNYKGDDTIFVRNELLKKLFPPSSSEVEILKDKLLRIKKIIEE